jgi:hypothetical protein
MTASPNSSDISSSAHTESERTPDQAQSTRDLQTSIAELARRSKELRDAGERLAADVEQLRQATVGNQAQAINASPSPISTDEIATVARQLWEQEGKPEGKSEEHWFRAEALVHQQQIAAAAGASVTPAPPAAVGLS